MIFGWLALWAIQADGPLPGVPEGWTIRLAARAPALQHPTVVCCAPDGRVFVGEDPMDMKPPASDARGRVVCLHPDGRITVFADGLYAPFGLMYLDGKLYVHHAPRLSRFVDDNGVGRDRVDLIECTHPNPWALDWNDHVPANVRLAMDGFLYMSVGDKGIFGAVGRDGSRAELRGGGILRLRPDGTALEVHSRGTRNHLDVAVNAEDELFTYDNTDEHHWMSRLTHMVEGGSYGYPWDFHPRRPYTLWMIADYGPGAACAGLSYDEDALPEEYRGNLFMVDFAKRNLLRLRVERQGAAFIAPSRRDFFSNLPPDFWPVGVAFAPDGLSFYVTDWVLYDRKDVTVGRLFKVSYAGKSRAAPRPDWVVPAAMGRPFSASVAELAGALSHPARDVRMTAQRRLAERGADALDPLTALLSDAHAPPPARWHALWTLEAIGAGRAAVTAAADDPDASVRRQAIRALGLRRAADAAALMRRRLEDAEAAVRLQAAVGLGRLGRADAVPALLDALEDKDEVVRYSAFTALNRIGRADPSAWEAIARGLEHPSPAVRQGAVFAMRETFEPNVAALLIQAARRPSVPPDARAAALEALAGICRREPPWNGEWWNGTPGVSPYHPALSPRPARTEAWEATDRVLQTLRAALEDPDPRVRSAAIEAIGAVRDRDGAGGLRALFDRETDVTIRIAVLETLGTLQDPDATALVASVLADAGAPAELLAQAVATAERIGGQDARAALLQFVAAPHGGKPVLLPALQALSKIGGDPVIDALLGLVKSPDPEIRRVAIEGLGQQRHRKAVPALLEAFGDEETRFEATAALAKTPDVRALDVYLYGVGQVNPDLRWPCSQALAAIGKEALPILERRLEAGALAPRVVGELQRIFAAAKESPIHRFKVEKHDPAAYVRHAVENRGDPQRGGKLFHDLRALACAKCHRVGGQGGEMGPDLSGIGLQYDRLQLAESIVFPSKSVREGYAEVVVKLDDETGYRGLVRAETPEELTLLDPEGRPQRIRKARIVERRVSGVSSMPERLEAGLSLQEFADVVSYLETLRNEPKKP
jgi:putative heme-binding domain-containing protein